MAGAYSHVKIDIVLRTSYGKDTQLFRRYLPLRCTSYCDQPRATPDHGMSIRRELDERRTSWEGNGCTRVQYLRSLGWTLPAWRKFLFCCLFFTRLPSVTAFPCNTRSVSNGKQPRQENLLHWPSHRKPALKMPYAPPPVEKMRLLPQGAAVVAGALADVPLHIAPPTPDPAATGPCPPVLRRGLWHRRRRRHPPLPANDLILSVKHDPADESKTSPDGW